MRINRIFLFGGFLASAILAQQVANDHEEFEYVRHEIAATKSVLPKEGFVPDAETAKAIAYAVTVPIYGSAAVDAEKPFRAELSNGRWTVLGTLHGRRTSGGTLIVQLEKATGEIRFVNHSM
jgi:hypothetical protein